jgi:methylated-DNA-protein-cysteine methyltransferase related protein
MPTDTYQRIYAAVKKIPYGKVATYGQIAQLADMPRAARQVGYALSATPENVRIPWHRVVSSEGRISMRRKNWQSGSDDLQKILLEAEGVEFDANERINLERFRWKPKTGPARKPA